MLFRKASIWVLFAACISPLHSTAEETSLHEALKVNAFINCLAWTRDGAPIEDLAVEGHLTRLLKETEGDPIWGRDLKTGSLQVRQHTDGSRACTVTIHGSTADSITDSIASVLDNTETPILDFRLQSEQTIGDISTRHYRQNSDKSISLTVSTRETGTESQPTGMLTFYYSNQSP